jgi:hypothetical protein
MGVNVTEKRAPITQHLGGLRYRLGFGTLAKRLLGVIEPAVKLSHLVY